LLIDDIFGELDPRRRNALLAFLPEKAQKLITATHLDWIDRGSLPEAIYRVREGTVTAAG
jgi:DNA replication and repair protein RecF